MHILECRQSTQNISLHFDLEASRFLKHQSSVKLWFHINLPLETIQVPGSIMVPGPGPGYSYENYLQIRCNKAKAISAVLFSWPWFDLG